MSEAVHWFRPNKHWNVVSIQVYCVLQRFYSEDRLKVTLEKS